jgi:hypothetical protein
VSAVPPLRREILVDADPATAFEVFTARIGQWWPLAELSVYGAGATVEIADPAAARAEYDQGWTMVLDRYREPVRGPEARRALRLPEPDA